MAVLGDVEAAAPGGGFKGGKKVAGKRPASASAARKKPPSTATKPQPASRPQSGRSTAPFHAAHSVSRHASVRSV